MFESSLAKLRAFLFHDTQTLNAAAQHYDAPPAGL